MVESPRPGVTDPGYKRKTMAQHPRIAKARVPGARTPATERMGAGDGGPGRTEAGYKGERPPSATGFPTPD